MAVTFNTTYTGNQLNEGVYTAPILGVVPAEFTGTSLASAALSVRIIGTVTTSGNTVQVSLNGAQPVTGIYEGYFNVNGAPVYVFQTGSLFGTGLPSAFAVSSTGAALPIEPLEILTTGPIPTCFLRGTHIATPDGEATVEQLQPGDLVATVQDGATTFRPVAWVGRRSVEVARNGGDIDDYPVRIQAGAFRDNVPHRDLLVTSEHCILVDGGLVPVRMLVNGSSIRVETSITAFEYFHVELDSHAILLAEGLETESYLDTGNRGTFANAPVPALRARLGVDAAHRNWATHAAAPLVVDRRAVEPIWTRLALRASPAGLPAPALTREPDLRLVTEHGIEIAPTLVEGKVHSFVVPGGTGHLRLLSRAARPSDVVGPFLDDRRLLGVLVGGIAIGDGRRHTASDAHLAAAPLGGWHAPEASGTCRWTSGDALLPVDLSACGGRAVFLDVEVLQAGPYLADAAASGRLAA